MRIAVIADVHANLAALDAVLDRIAGAAVGATICLGDLVGYNAEPEPCIYDIDRTCTANARAGLPDELSARLREGR
jgi:Icc-related predicted phosphoesterase